MPVVTLELPSGLSNTNVGMPVLDLLPLVTMAACLPTLWLYWRGKRWIDLVSSSAPRDIWPPTFSVQVLFSIGFALATIYHAAHMHSKGLESSSILGVAGPMWRTLDVLCAQWLLGRTWGHAIGARSLTNRLVTNLVFPAVCLHLMLAATDALPMRFIVRTLGSICAGSLVLKLAQEGVSSFPKYQLGRGLRTLGCIIIALVAFPMPERFPRHYWLFHSIWHVFLSVGYYELYRMIEEETTVSQPAQAVQPGSPHLPHKLSQSSSGHRLDECVQGKQRAALYAESDAGSSIAGHSGTTLRESSPLQQHLEVSSQPTTPPARIEGWPLHRLRRRAE